MIDTDRMAEHIAQLHTLQVPSDERLRYYRAMTWLRAQHRVRHSGGTPDDYVTRDDAGDIVPDDDDAIPYGRMLDGLPPVWLCPECLTLVTEDDPGMAVNSEVRVTELTALSEYQREVLLWMRGRYRDSLRYYAANPHMDWHRRNWWGVRLGAADGVSRSQSASMSRSIRRLEQRGLIVRANTRWRNPSSTGPGELERLAKGNHRTTNVLFTPTGWDVAELLDSA